MPGLEGQMNRFERVLFRVALLLAILIVALRIGFAFAMWYVHHLR